MDQPPTGSHGNSRNTSKQEELSCGVQGDETRRLVVGPAAAQPSVKAMTALPTHTIAYPLRDRQTREQFRLLDKIPVSLFANSCYKEVRKANELAQQAGASLAVPARSLQPTSHPQATPDLDQAPSDISAQGTSVTPAPVPHTLAACKTVPALQGFRYDQAPDQPLAGDSTDSTLLLQNDSVLSLPMAPELSEDGESAISERLPTTPSLLESPNAAPASWVDEQRNLNVGRAEISSNEGPMALILRSKLGPSTSVQPGFVFNPITGEHRRRLMMDDFPGLTRKLSRKQWRMYMDKERNERPLIDGYEEGDSELELSEWEEEKATRASMKKNKKRKLFRR
ncbi:hypothetical protein V8E51_014192 [Hyaloscypha variabilis]